VVLFAQSIAAAKYANLIIENCCPLHGWPGRTSYRCRSSKDLTRQTDPLRSVGSILRDTFYTTRRFLGTSCIPPRRSEATLLCITNGQALVIPHRRRLEPNHHQEMHIYTHAIGRSYVRISLCKRTASHYVAYDPLALSAH
jgi:hypothetical protein